jgi:hypothetical protein
MPVAVFFDHLALICLYAKNFCDSSFFFVPQVESQLEVHAQTLTQHGFQAFFEFSQKKMSHNLRYAQNPYPTWVVVLFLFSVTHVSHLFSRKGVM